MNSLTRKQILAALGLTCFLAGPSAPLSPPAVNSVAEAAKFSSFGGRGMRRMGAHREFGGRRIANHRRFMRGERIRSRRRMFPGERIRMRRNRHFDRNSYRHHRRYNRHGGRGPVFSGPGLLIEINNGGARNNRQQPNAAHLQRLKTDTALKAARAIKKLLERRQKEARSRVKNPLKRQIYKRFGIGRYDAAIRKLTGQILGDLRKLRKKPGSKMSRTFNKRYTTLLRIIKALSAKHKKYSKNGPIEKLKAKIKEIEELKRTKKNKAVNERYLKGLKEELKSLEKTLKELRDIQKKYDAALKAGIK